MIRLLAAAGLAAWLAGCTHLDGRGVAAVEQLDDEGAVIAASLGYRAPASYLRGRAAPRD